MSGLLVFVKEQVSQWLPSLAKCAHNTVTANIKLTVASYHNLMSGVESTQRAKATYTLLHILLQLYYSYYT